MSNPSRPTRFGPLRAMKERGEMPTTEATESEHAGQETAPAVPERPSEAQSEASAPPAPVEPPEVSPARPAAKRAGRAVPAKRSDPDRKGPGRPPGKRSDEEYRQVAGLVRRDTYKATQLRLLQEDREFSELLETLLAKWVKGEIRA